MNKVERLVELLEELSVARRDVDENPNCAASSRNLDEVRDDLHGLFEEMLD